MNVTYAIAHTGAATVPYMAAELTAGDRLLQLREQAHLSLREAAGRSGLSHGHIREIEKIPGKAENMTASTMRGLAIAYGTTVEHIVRIATGRPLPPTDDRQLPTSPLLVDLGGSVMVRYMGDVSAGLLSVGTDEPVRMMEIPTAFLGGYAPDDVYALRVNGNSMLSDDARRSIADGSIVLVNEHLQPLAGQLVVVWLHDQDLGVIKAWNPKGDGVWLVSYNGEHAPIHVDEASPGTLHGVVIGHWTRAPGF